MIKKEITYYIVYSVNNNRDKYSSWVRSNVSKKADPKGFKGSIEKDLKKLHNENYDVEPNNIFIHNIDLVNTQYSIFGKRII